MSKSSKIISKKEKTKEQYPYMGVSDGKVVLFTRKATGMVLVSTVHIQPIGFMSSSWIEDLFTPVDSISIEFNL